MQMYLAESRFPADERGNRAAIYDRHSGSIIVPPPGQYIQPVPNHYAPHIHYDYKDTSSTTRVSEEQKGAFQLTQPSQEHLLSQLPENGLIVSPGIKATDGQVVKVSIVDVPHFKILGATGFGKSCLAAALMHQATQLNSPDLLQLALLDLEHKTSRLFESLPHVATLQSGRRQIQMVATTADEVAEHLGYLKKELDRRAVLRDEELSHEPILIMYVEEMLSLYICGPSTSIGC